MAKLPARYAHLTKAPAPPLLVTEALKEFGTLEGPGTANNPKITSWADEVARAMPTRYNNWAADWYNADSIAWCGLFTAVCALRASQGRPERLPVKNYLSALAWADYGLPVQYKGREGLRLGEILVGDILVFVRKGGGHVGICVGISSTGKTAFCLGGNQENRVTISEISLGRLYAVRRPPYRVRPAGARHIRLTTTGVVSKDES